MINQRIRQGRSRSAIVESVWNEYQDHVDAMIANGKPPTWDAYRILIVCEEAMSARHTDGRRYFDICREVGLI